jgi:hypothetical protein
MALGVSEQKLPIYNEPLKEFKGDVVPVGGWPPRLRLVRACSIELERRLLVCGVDPQSIA